jgi:hypothetical protein
MEVVAHLAGELHSDGPRTACPVLAAFVRALNDRIDDPRLRGIVLGGRLHRLVGTAAHPEVTDARAYAIADATARRFAVAACERLGDSDSALALATLDPIQDRLSATFARIRFSGLPDELLERLAPARWTVMQASRGVLRPELWVGGAIRAAELADRADRWPFAAAELLDVLIDLPRRDALFWDSEAAGRRRDI